ncbi:hypothetical protein ACFX2C_042905 [Malus domestica]
MQASFVVSLGDQAHVPILSFSATSPSLSSLRSSYFFQITQTDSYQVKVIRDLVKYFGWRQVVPIYVHDTYGEGIIRSLIDALQEVDAHVPYRSVISPSATDDQIGEQIDMLMRMQKRVFIVHMMPNLSSSLFSKAKEIGMMSEGYVWIITNGVGNRLWSMRPILQNAMQGVLGVETDVPKTVELNKFKMRWRRQFQQDNPTMNVLDVDYLDTFKVSQHGLKLARVLSTTRFKGIAGDFSLVDGHLQSSTFKIVNVNGDGVTKNSRTDTTEITGFSIDVFKAVLGVLPYDLPYEFIPYENPDGTSAGSYNDLLSQVHLKNFDAVVGDTTIRASRSLYVDFTMPYTESGVVMVVPTRDTRKKVVSNLARFLMIIWVFVVLVRTQSYTANLASLLTVQQLQPTVTDVKDLVKNGVHVGYMNGSFVYELLKEIGFEESKLKAVNSMEESDEALSKGSGKGGIAAVIDETPNMKLFVANLGLESFWGLFLIAGAASILALVIFAVSFLYNNRHILKHAEHSRASKWGRVRAMFEIFNDKDLSSYNFKSNQQRDGSAGVRDEVKASPNSNWPGRPFNYFNHTDEDFGFYEGQQSPCTTISHAYVEMQRSKLQGHQW